MSGVDDDELIGMCLTSWHKLGLSDTPSSDLHTVPKEIMEAGMLKSHACTTTNIIRLLRTREEVLEINDCTQTNYPEFFLHHSPKVFQFSNDLLSC